MNLGLELAPIGAIVAERTFGPISREDLRRYAAASGDLNPLHLDPAFAAQAGFDDVIVHGMLGMALLGRLLDENIVKRRLLAFRSRFRNIIKIDEAIVCRARLASRTHDVAALTLEMRSLGDAVLIEGSATVELL
jgi:acyl dehydratase